MQYITEMSLYRSNNQVIPQSRPRHLSVLQVHEVEDEVRGMLIAALVSKVAVVLVGQLLIETSVQYNREGTIIVLFICFIEVIKVLNRLHLQSKVLELICHILLIAWPV